MKRDECVTVVKILWLNKDASPNSIFTFTLATAFAPFKENINSKYNVGEIIIIKSLKIEFQVYLVTERAPYS